MIQNFDGSENLLGSERFAQAMKHLEKFCHIFKPESRKSIFQSIIQEMLQRQFMKSLAPPIATETQENLQELKRFESEFSIVDTIYKSSKTTVFAAVNHIDRSIYAIKRVTFMMDEIQPEIVMQEASIMQQCIHPNIAKYYNSWIEFIFKKQLDEASRDAPNFNFEENADANSKTKDGSDDIFEFQFFIQMELCTKQNIVDACRNTDLNQRIQLLLDTATGLAYLHDKGIIHMNIRPSNILMSIECIPKICDFGKAISSLTMNKQCETSRIDPFIAPECPDSITTKSDIYAFGLLMAFCLIDDDECTFIEQLRNNQKINIPGLPDYVSQLILDCMNFDPEKRPTITRINELLMDAANDLMGVD